MLSAFLIALREGVEAALVVGIVLVYLNRTGRANLARWVWGGVLAAVASSLAVAIALERWKVSEDGFEGLLLLVAAVFVVTMIIWMNRVARHLKTEIEKRVEKHAAKSEFSAGIGLATFVFLMVVREGAELALILRAVELSTEGLAVWIGTILGTGRRDCRGSVLFPGDAENFLGRFFSATSTILIIVAVQLALTGVHELSEAMWLPSSRVEMAYVGPIVRNEFFFFTVILGAAALARPARMDGRARPGGGECAGRGGTPSARMGAPQAAPLGVRFGIHLHCRHPDSGRGIRVHARDRDDRGPIDPVGKRGGSHSPCPRSAMRIFTFTAWTRAEQACASS